MFSLIGEPVIPQPVLKVFHSIKQVSEQTLVSRDSLMEAAGFRDSFYWSRFFFATFFPSIRVVHFFLYKGSKLIIWYCEYNSSNYNLLFFSEKIKWILYILIIIEHNSMFITYFSEKIVHLDRKLSFLLPLYRFLQT